MASKTFTVSDVAKHKDEKEGGMYIIIDTGVYDVTGQSIAQVQSSMPLKVSCAALFTDTWSLVASFLTLAVIRDRFSRQPSRRQKGPSTRCRQGCEPAILEIPQ
jgi:hypothetical protein